MMARHTEADVNVIALIGERGREVREFIERDLGPDGLARSVVVVATSDQPALVRIKGAMVATTIASISGLGRDVLFVMDRDPVGLAREWVWPWRTANTRGYNPPVRVDAKLWNGRPGPRAHHHLHGLVEGTI